MMNDPDKPPHVDVTLVSFRGLTNGDTHFTFSVLEKDRRIALELFSEIGATGFLVRIKPDAARNKMIRDAGAPPEPTGQNCNKAINLCKDITFWRFLGEKYGCQDITSEHFAAKHLKRILKIETRRALDSSILKGARRNFTELVAEFEVWLKGDVEL